MELPAQEMEPVEIAEAEEVAVPVVVTEQQADVVDEPVEITEAEEVAVPVVVAEVPVDVVDEPVEEAPDQPALQKEQAEAPEMDALATLQAQLAEANARAAALEAQVAAAQAASRPDQTTAELLAPAADQITLEELTSGIEILSPSIGQELAVIESEPEPDPADTEEGRRIIARFNDLKMAEEAKVGEWEELFDALQRSHEVLVSETESYHLVESEYMVTLEALAKAEDEVCTLEWRARAYSGHWCAGGRNGPTGQRCRRAGIILTALLQIRGLV